MVVLMLWAGRTMSIVGTLDSSGEVFEWTERLGAWG
jgi:hypothetical protein